MFVVCYFKNFFNHSVLLIKIICITIPGLFEYLHCINALIHTEIYLVLILCLTVLCPIFVSNALIQVVLIKRNLSSNVVLLQHAIMQSHS